MTERHRLIAAARKLRLPLSGSLVRTLHQPFVFGLVFGLVGCAMLWSAPLAGARERLASQLGVRLPPADDTTPVDTPAEAVWQHLLLQPHPSQPNSLRQTTADSLRQTTADSLRQTRADAWIDWEQRLRRRNDHATVTSVTRPVH